MYIQRLVVHFIFALLRISRKFSTSQHKHTLFSSVFAIIIIHSWSNTVGGGVVVAVFFSLHLFTLPIC